MSERVLGIEHPNTIQEYVSTGCWGACVHPKSVSLVSASREQLQLSFLLQRSSQNPPLSS